MQSQVNYRRNKTFNVTSEYLNESNIATQDELEDLVPLQLPAFDISFKKIRYEILLRTSDPFQFYTKKLPPIRIKVRVITNTLKARLLPTIQTIPNYSTRNGS